MTGIIQATAAYEDWLAAHVPGAQVEVSEQGGHLYIDPEAEIMHALHWLRDAVG